MSDQWGGPGWWVGGDGLWYPPRDDVPVRRKDHLAEDAGAATVNPEIPMTPRVSTHSDGQGLFDQSAPLAPANHAGDDVPLIVEEAAASEPIAPQAPVAPLVIEEIDLVDDAPPSHLSVAGTAGVDQADAADTTVEDNVDWPVINLRADIASKATETPSSLATPAEVGSGSVASSGWLEGAATETFDARPSGQGVVPEVPEVPEVAPPRVTFADVDPGANAATGMNGDRMSGDPLSSGPPVSRHSLAEERVESMLAETPENTEIPTPFETTAPPPAPASENPGASESELFLNTSQSVDRIPTSDVVPVPPTFEDDRSRNRTGFVLLAVATFLAVLSGILGALWLRERTSNADLRAQLDEVPASASVDANIDTDEDLRAEIEALAEENRILDQQIADMSALVQELPVGRITEVSVPFNPVFADESSGRLIAVGEDGEFVVWADGIDGPITDTGTVGGSPTGLFAAPNRAWVSTDATQVAVLPLANDNELFFVEYGPARFLAEEQRHFWTFNEELGEVAQIRKADGEVTNTVSLPSPVVDLTAGAGSVWALGEDGLVYRINTADLTVQALEVGEALVSITAGPDSLWTLSGADGALRRVDPVSGEVLVTVPVGRDPVDATFAGSSVWVGLRSGESLIEVDTRTSAVVSRTTLPDAPTGLHRGESGVFVTMEGDIPLVQVASLIAPDGDADAGADADPNDG